MKIILQLKYCIVLFIGTMMPVIAGNVTDSMFPIIDEAKVQLGQLLMFDKILSGNKNISCATCHHPLTELGDGLSLSIGEGGQGLGISRNTGIATNSIHERVPRNAPPLFNIGALEFTDMFHDGRVAVSSSEPSGFLSPAGEQLPNGLDNVLAAQAMFPVTSGTEMAGQRGENLQANKAIDSSFSGEFGLWNLIAKRLRAIPEYVDLFTVAYDTINNPEDITYVHAANAIAAFETVAWRCTNSPFDRYYQYKADGIRPLNVASPNAVIGAGLFYGKAKCSNCHSGHFQTDHKYYAIGIPQIGPGKGDNAEGYKDGTDDFGRERVTGNRFDRYKFRTPSLRQVAQTGPWGHDGAFNSLEKMVRHHLDAVNSLNNYDETQAVLPFREDLNEVDFVVQKDVKRRQNIVDAIEINPISLTDTEVERILDFLHTLTDQNCIDLSNTAPMRVPSGLPVFD
jgi:cytochrome c peroxidase